jgi:hypothetical protein
LQRLLLGRSPGKLQVQLVARPANPLNKSSIASIVAVVELCGHDLNPQESDLRVVSARLLREEKERIQEYRGMARGGRIGRAGDPHLEVGWHAQADLLIERPQLRGQGPQRLEVAPWPDCSTAAAA